MNACSCINCLYNNNKFKKIFGDKIISYSNAFQFIVYNSFQFIFGNQMNSPTTIERIQYAFVGQSSIYFSVCQDVLLLLGVGLDAIY